VRTEISTTAFTDDAIVGTPIETTVGPTTDLLSGVRVAEFGPMAAGTYWVRVSLVTAAGRVIASRVTDVRLAGLRSITSVISRSCEDLLCPPSSAPTLTVCHGGACVDPRCTPETPDLCGPGECASDADCVPDAGAECARAACEGGVCLYAADDSLCGASAHCTALLTCVTCGVVGAPCCDGRTCGAMSECAEGTCRRCGRNGLSCCPGGSCLDGSLCTETAFGNFCACGHDGEVCCGASDCVDGSRCTETMFGNFCACGENGQVCCAGRSCDPGTLCRTTPFGNFCACGHRDEICCLTGVPCVDGSTCTGTGFGPICM
jgi:hypothetical protein